MLVQTLLFAFMLQSVYALPPSPILPAAPLPDNSSCREIQPQPPEAMRFRIENRIIPDFDYHPYLTLQSHMLLFKDNLQGIYINRKFWNDLCIFRQAVMEPQYNEYPFFDHAIEYLAKSVKGNLLADINTDRVSLHHFRFLIVSMIELPPHGMSSVSLVEYWDQPTVYPSLVTAYENEVSMWKDHLKLDIISIVNMLARSYLVRIIIYLSYLNNFNTPQLLREGGIMYDKLTSYTYRYDQQMSYNLHANLLCQADALFFHHYI